MPYIWLICSTHRFTLTILSSLRCSPPHVLLSPKIPISYIKYDFMARINHIFQILLILSAFSIMLCTPFHTVTVVSLFLRKLHYITFHPIWDTQYIHISDITTLFYLRHRLCTNPFISHSTTIASLAQSITNLHFFLHYTLQNFTIIWRGRRVSTNCACAQVIWSLEYISGFENKSSTSHIVLPCSW